MNLRQTCQYLEFDLNSPARFPALQNLFQALKSEKDKIIASWDDEAAAQDDPSSKPDWNQFLDREAVAWFSDIFDYDSEEGQVYRKLWDLTSPAVRLEHPMFHLPGNWDFESMIDAIFHGEYALVSLVKESDSAGVFYYSPYAYPFGGSECLVALIESFGNTVTFDSWHQGPHRRHTVGWDYALAKRLVAARRGFEP